MERLIEIAKELSGMSIAHGVKVDVVAFPDGYFTAQCGEYEITKLRADKEVVVKYEPLENIDEWQYNIPIESVRIGQAPKLESEEKEVEENIEE